MKKKSIDTNLIIRYLTEDSLKQAEAVEQLLKEAEDLEIPDVIFAEIVWVLTSFYKLGKDEIANKLEGLLSLDAIFLNGKLLAKSIEIFRNHNILYTDAYLAAYALRNNDGFVYSFDQGFDRIEEITRVEPKI